MLKHMPRHLLGRHVPEQLPGYVLKHVLENALKHVPENALSHVP